MSARLVALVVVIVAFGVLSAMAVAESGLVGIFKPLLTTWGGAQVLVDLVILALLACIWMVRDARSHGRSAWPFVVLTLAAGSFGVLFYLVARELRATPGRAAST